MKERQKEVESFKDMATQVQISEMFQTRSGSLPVGVRISESGNSSKFDVSSMLLISMGMAAGRSLGNRSEKLETG